MGPLNIRLQIERTQDVLIVRLHGELDHHASDQVRTQVEEELEKADYSYLILNLEGLSFMDSSGLGVILGRYKTISERGGTMVLCSVQPSIYKLMEMSGLFKIISIHNTQESAMDACGVAL